MSKLNSTISHDRLLEVLHYNPETGIFTWKERISIRIKVGNQAGVVNKMGYTYIGIFGAMYLAHRLAWFYMTSLWPNEIDHIDHSPRNNRFSNLRDTTHKHNGKNLKISKANRSGVTGVFFNKPNNNWKSRIANHEGKGIHLYSGFDYFEAVCARKSAENIYNYHPNHGR